MTSLGGLCLELLSGKGLESAFLEGIGLKHETVLCHHGAVFSDTPMEPSREGAPGGLGQSFGFPLPPLKFRTAGFPQYGFKWTVNGDLRRRPKA